MDLETLLFSQGFGSRRQCRGIVAEGRVRIGDAVQHDPQADVPVVPPPDFEVDDQAWTYREKAYIALNKPAGYECSRDPQHHLSVFHLLPPQLAERGVQSVGRLDQDTTGLLLLSDDDAFVHAFTSPKRKVPKIYLATVRHALDDNQLTKLREGVLLHGETQPSVALAAVRRDDHLLELTVLEGKYHQVKRMVAAAGNRVEKLHREQMGGYALPETLAEGAGAGSKKPISRCCGGNKRTFGASMLLHHNEEWGKHAEFDATSFHSGRTRRLCGGDRRAARQGQETGPARQRRVIRRQVPPGPGRLRTGRRSGHGTPGRRVSGGGWQAGASTRGTPPRHWPNTAS